MFEQINKSRNLMGVFASLLQGALSSYDKQYAPIFSGDEFERELEKDELKNKWWGNRDLADNLLLFGCVALYLIINIATLLGWDGILYELNKEIEPEEQMSAVGFLAVTSFVGAMLFIFAAGTSWGGAWFDYRKEKLGFLKKVISEHDEWKARVVPTLEKAHMDSEFISLGQEFQSGDSVYQLCGFVQENRHVILLRRVQKGSAHSMSDWVINNMKWGLVAVTMDEFAKIYVGDDLSMDEQSWARRSIRYTPN
jgi:hypothetical protein